MRIRCSGMCLSCRTTILLLLIYCLMDFPLFVGVLCLSLFCYALLCVHSSFAIILNRTRKLVALLLLSYRCIVSINVLWLFLTVLWVGLQCVIVVFPDHTHVFYYDRALNLILLQELVYDVTKGPQTVLRTYAIKYFPY